MIGAVIDGIYRANNLGGGDEMTVSSAICSVGKRGYCNIGYPVALGTVLVVRHSYYPVCHGIFLGATKRRQFVMDPLAGINGNCFILTVKGLAQEAV